MQRQVRPFLLCVYAHCDLVAPLLSHLASGIQFDFIDAPFEGSPAPGIAEQFKPPYFVWNRHYTPSEVSNVHDYVRTTVAQKGAYDGVVGFSEGAALAAALLLDDAADTNSRHKPIFRFAVFFNAINVLSPSEALMRDLREGDVQSSLDTFDIGHAVRDDQPLDFLYGLLSDVVSTPITIPTLHIIGLEDAFCEFSQDLVKLCRPDSATVISSKIGHELPKSPKLDRVAHELENMLQAASLET